MTSSNTQRGQIIVLFALVLVGLLAFAGLAIDGAMVYSDRRANQSAADSASMAGGGAGATYMQLHDMNASHDFNCSDLNIIGKKMNLVKHEIIDAVIFRASTNGFTIDTDITDDNGVKVTCTSTDFDKYLDIEVRITSQTNTNFLHLVSNQPLMNTVTATTRIRPTRPSGGGFAIAATDRTDCGQNSGGVYFDGKIDTHLDGGGIYSGTCITINGKGSVAVSNSEPGVFRTGGTPNFIGDDPIKDPSMQLDIDIPEPDCAALTDTHSQKKQSGTISPGVYSNGIDSQGDLTLKPGLYCIDGALKINGQNKLTGYGVSIVMLGSNTVTINGGGEVNLYAPSAAYPAASPAVSGVLFYAEQGDIKLVGNGVGAFAGTIYAPKGEIEVGGTGDVNPTYHTEMIADHVKIHGNAAVNINYDGNNVYLHNPTLDLLR
ncbi:putative Flp pilus-assembly TadE/G-like [Longilinea arvoryzae]|uniref:Putative Flp pilus-assembly TadE/G-like n=1 Tax=Longilinea arvoryzae TaxID=360412 RepID=A0A0S7BPB2_9CHLR|nr:Tad domain-containing protein [Longilinea arvoryzae]GAP15653.1 putative Flp pilus-assembly TadE/G-like [Longilinea arvoryzae]